LRPKRPSILSVDRKYEGNRISLRIDTAQFEDGPEFDKEIIEHPGSVVLIPITDEGQVLLIRQYRLAAGKELLEASAGTRESGEEPETTAHRELQEEVGYKAGTLIRIGGSWVAPGYSTEYTHNFIAKDLVYSPLAQDDGEDIVVEAHDFSEIPELIRSGELEDQMTIAALLSAQHVYEQVLDI